MNIATRPLNPVLSRELTQRMRGPRAMVMLSAYLAILSIIVVLVYRAESTSATSGFNGSPVTQVAGVGQGLFEWTLLFTLLLVLFLVPGFTAGAIAGERERQTLLPMQVTLLSPRSIVLGKIGASVLFTMLLVVATLPLLAVSYLIGGVNLRDVVVGLAMVLFTAVALAAVSVACSTFMKRVQTATVMAYGLVLLLSVATFGIFVVARQIDQSRGFDTADPPSIIVAPNPIAALADLTGDDPTPFQDEVFGPFGGFSSGNSDAPLSGIRDLLTPDVFSDAVAFEQVRADGVAIEAAVQIDEFGNVVGDVGRGRDDGFPLWGQNMLIMGGLAALAVVGSSRRLRTPAKTER